jgi:hypothetical protein
LPTAPGGQERVTTATPEAGATTTYKEALTMQYLLLIYENEQRYAQGFPEGEMAGYMAFGKEYATAVRVREGKTLTTDGPFAETKEQLGGFYLVEASDQKEAVAMAAKIPGAASGSVEVRPIMKYS